MVKLSKIIRRRYSDFYTAEDYLEGKRVQGTLLVTDLDKKGRILNPKAPCVVTVIDDKYSEDANKNKSCRKFNVKSDVLKLRDITRNKFFIYVTQQRALEKAREQQLHSVMYKRTQKFLKMSSKQLNTLKNEHFCSMITENKKIETFLHSDIFEEVKQQISIHQRLSIEVMDAHKKFIFLLKLIDYFSVNKEGICILELTRRANTSELTVLKSDFKLEEINNAETEKLKEYITTTVKPCLNEEMYSNMEFWIEGYANTRLKVFDYYKEFTKLAIQFHTFQMVYSKFLNTNSNRIVKPIARNMPQHLISRTKYLQENTTRLLEASAGMHTRSNISLHIKGLAPVILNKIQQAESNEKRIERHNETSKLEAIHTHLMQLLANLDDLDARICVEKEKEVRKLIARDRERSRKVLVKVNRFQNWIEHYKKHVHIK